MKIMSLEELRKKAGMSREKLAEQLKCSASSIAKIERGITGIPLMIKIKEYLLGEIAIKMQSKYNECTSDIKEVLAIEAKMAKNGQYYIYEVHTTLAVAIIKYDAYTSRFYITHKPIKADKELLARESKIANLICKTLNACDITV